MPERFGQHAPDVGPADPQRISPGGITSEGVADDDARAVAVQAGARRQASGGERAGGGLQREPVRRIGDDVSGRLDAERRTFELPALEQPGPGAIGGVGRVQVGLVVLGQVDPRSAAGGGTTGGRSARRRGERPGRRRQESGTQGRRRRRKRWPRSGWPLWLRSRQARRGSAQTKLTAAAQATSLMPRSPLPGVRSEQIRRIRDINSAREQVCIFPPDNGLSPLGQPSSVARYNRRSGPRQHARPAPVP